MNTPPWMGSDCTYKKNHHPCMQSLLFVLSFLSPRQHKMEKLEEWRKGGFCCRRGKLVLQKHASHFKIQLLEMGKKEPCFLKGCMALYYNNNRRLVCEEHPIKSLEIKWGLIKTTWRFKNLWWLSCCFCIEWKWCLFWRSS